MAMDPKLKATTLDAILASLRQGATISSACAAAHLAVSTLTEWRKTDDKIKQDVLEARESTILLAEGALFEKALTGSLGHLAFFLCNRAPDRWQNVNKVEHSGGLNHEHTMAEFAAEFGGTEAARNRVAAYDGADKN